MDALKNISKKNWTRIGIVAILLIIIFGGVHLWNNRKISVLSHNASNVHFTGYNGSGEVAFNSGNVMMKTMVKRVKLGDYWTNKLLARPDDIEDWQNDGDASSSEDGEKLSKISQWYKETSVTVSKSGNLSNGDTVTLKVDTGNDKSNPIKPESKTFKVKGLEKIKTIATSSLFKELKVSFTGFNGRGQTVVKSQNSDWKSANDLTVENNGHLSNGDKVKIKAPDGFFDDDDKNFTGNDYFTVKVHGLKPLTKFKNIREVQKLTDALIDKEYSSDDFSDYVNTFQSMYLVPYTDDDADALSEDVTVNRIGDYSGTQLLEVDVLYSVLDKDDEDAKPDTYKVSLTELKYDSKGNINISKLNTDDNSSIQIVDNAKTAEHNFKTNGIQIK
ncbi:hypothetical protein [Levilactobacillus huananensis]|uniref:hypothetical protein n=1 Tax=Levilactobacillus huananensis TaxID=2486019 RepID=UPI000F78FDA6|nr:hypothetical protein [Levilactobacillus huananensis]